MIRCLVETGLYVKKTHPSAAGRTERGLGAATQARHLRGDSGLVQENQPVRFKPHPWLPRGRPLLARLPDVGPILFAGQQCFF
jgi:hypothetical protein